MKGDWVREYWSKLEIHYVCRSWWNAPTRAEGASRRHCKEALDNLWFMAATGRNAQKLEEKKCGPHFQEGQEEGPMELQATLPHSHLCPSTLVTGDSWKEPGSILFLCPAQYGIKILIFLLSVLTVEDLPYWKLSLNLCFLGIIFTWWPVLDLFPCDPGFLQCYWIRQSHGLS